MDDDDTDEMMMMPTLRPNPTSLPDSKISKTLDKLIPTIKRADMHSLVMMNLDPISYDDDDFDAADDIVGLMICIMSNKIDILKNRTMAIISIVPLFIQISRVLCFLSLCQNQTM